MTFATVLDPWPHQPTLGFYIHVPFCPHICPYCDFIKTDRFQKADVQSYFGSLEKQLDAALTSLQDINANPLLKEFWELKAKPLVTVYCGGGTPGLFPARYYEPLLQKIGALFTLDEVTIETNPFTNRANQLEAYRRVGFNRITIGGQSLCAQTLQFLGRKHKPVDVLQSIQWAREAGFPEAQVDLIYGMTPGLRTVPLESEVRQICEAGATGISAYFLTRESRTLFANVPCTDDEQGHREYLSLLHESAQHGLVQFETSNFCRTRPKHNSLYWQGYPYVGLGTGAHGLLPPTPSQPYGQRYRVGPVPQTLAPGNDNLPFQDKDICADLFASLNEAPRTQLDWAQETIFTSLRTVEGLNLKALASALGQEDFQHKLEKHAKLSRAFDEGLLVVAHDRVCVSAPEKIRGDMWALEIITALL